MADNALIPDSDKLPSAADLKEIAQEIVAVVRDEAAYTRNAAHGSPAVLDVESGGDNNDDELENEEWLKIHETMAKLTTTLELLVQQTALTSATLNQLLAMEKVETTTQQTDPVTEEVETATQQPESIPHQNPLAEAAEEVAEVLEPAKKQRKRF